MDSTEDGHFVDNNVGLIFCVHKLAGDNSWLRLMADKAHYLDREVHHQPFPCFFSIFPHASFSATVRLKTGAPGFESGSAQKYPRRSN